MLHWKNTMDKKSQSILDIILPTDISRQYKITLNNKEAHSLYKIWDGGSENNHDFVVPKDVDEGTVLSLHSKGYLEFKATGHMASSRSIARTNYSDKVEFTNKAKEAIKKIILFIESSSFDKDTDAKVDYQLALSADNKQITKTASVIKNVKQSWLRRAM